MLTLPSEPSARVDAELALAQARLAEAVEATGRHDDRAAIAALDAYDVAIERLKTAGEASAARAREAIQFHRSVLLEVAANAPAGAAAGLERALQNSSRVIESLGSEGGPVTGTGVRMVPGTGTRRSPRLEATAKLGRTPDHGAPEATAKPGKTPDLDRPEATAKPGKTPDPGRP